MSPGPIALGFFLGVFRAFISLPGLRRVLILTPPVWYHQGDWQLQWPVQVVSAGCALEAATMFVLNKVFSEPWRLAKHPYLAEASREGHDFSIFDEAWEAIGLTRRMHRWLMDHVPPDKIDYAGQLMVAHIKSAEPLRIHFVRCDGEPAFDYEPDPDEVMALTLYSPVKEAPIFSGAREPRAV